MKKIMLPMTMILSSAYLIACAPYHPSDERAAICNELNSQIIFNGSSGSARQTDIDHAEDPMLRKTYDAYHCDRAPAR